MYYSGKGYIDDSQHSDSQYVIPVHVVLANR